MLDKYELTKTADGSLSLQHLAYGEKFHSGAGALSEARDLYIKSSSFLASESPRVLDIGLGLGYNALSTLTAWEGASSHLTLCSIELDSELIGLLRSGQAPWQDGWPESWLSYCRALAPRGDAWILESEFFTWKVYCADVLDFELAGKFDYIWHDPFSPQFNSGLWDKACFTKLRSHVVSGAELLTYSVSRSTKMALEESGWSWSLLAPPSGHRKRNWLLARPLMA